MYSLTGAWFYININANKIFMQVFHGKIEYKF